MSMKKTIFQLCFLLAILSTLWCCRNEEFSTEDSSQQRSYNSSARFASKSFWKEDEVYINKVQQVFMKVANMEHVKSRYGDLYWDYAMTFGQFGESYLLVPIVKDNRVVLLMEAVREGNKVYFFEKEDKGKIDFFHAVIFSKITDYGEKTDSQNSTSSRNTPVFQCSTRWITIGCTDKDPNCTPYTTSETICKWVPGTTPKTFDPIGMDDGGGGGDGYEYPDPPEMDDPCKKAESSMTSANTILKNSEVKQKMDVALKGKIQAPNEWAVAIGQKPNGEYEITPPVEQNISNGTIPSAQLTSPYIGDGHSHSGDRGNPSGGDLYNMITSLAGNPALKYRFVYGNSGEGTAETYALVINNASLAQQFLSQYPKDENYNSQDHSIKEKSMLGIEFYKADVYYQSGASENSSGEDYDSRAVAMAYILDKFNAGISIAKADANGNLKKINAEVTQITVPYSGGKIKDGVKVSKCP